MSDFNLAARVDPGEGRMWKVVHEPRKPKTPLRLELRVSVLDSASQVKYTELVTYAEVVATEEALEQAAQALLEAQRLVGVYQA